MTGQELHLALNHLPVAGAFWVLLVLVAAWIRPSAGLVRTGLILTVLIGITSFVAYKTGEAAEEEVEHMPGIVEAAIEVHEDLGKRALLFGEAAALVALISLFFARGNPERRRLVVPTMVTLAAALVMLGWASHEGGKIHRPELSEPGAGDSVHLGDD